MQNEIVRKGFWLPSTQFTSEKIFALIYKHKYSTKYIVNLWLSLPANSAYTFTFNLIIKGLVMNC